ncbi:MAG: aldo/keto reductase [Trueperaceae bacterium]
MPVCRTEGLGVIPWSPLRGGWLSGKFERGMKVPVAGSRVEKAESEDWSEKWSNYDNEHTWSVLDVLHESAERLGRHPAQVAIRWLVQRPGVSAPIVGARDTAQLETNLGSVGWELDGASMRKLDEASAPELPYSYDVLAKNATR